MNIYEKFPAILEKINETEKKRYLIVHFCPIPILNFLRFYTCESYKTTTYKNKSKLIFTIIAYTKSGKIIDRYIGEEKLDKFIKKFASNIIKNEEGS